MADLSAALLPAGMSMPLALSTGAAPFAGLAIVSFMCGGRCATTSRAFSASAASPGESPAASSCNAQNDCSVPFAATFWGPASWRH